MRISDLRFEGVQKQAGPENPGQQQLENDFAHMAYVFLQDRAPLFIPYMLGFETVEQNTDGSRAVGIFGFKVGNKMYYIPVFFINGQIRGMDVIFSKEENRTMALTEDQIMAILDADKLEITGNAADESVREEFENPDLTSLVVPPSTKRASMREDWSKFAYAVLNAFETDPQLQESMLNALKAASGEAPEYTGPGALHSYFSNHGGPDVMKKFFRAAAENPKLASAALTFYPSLEDLYVEDFDPSLAPVKQAEKVTVVTRGNDYPVNLSEEDRTELVRDGFTVIDRREDAEKSELYEVSTAQYTNPTEAGLYNVLLEGGVISELWCIPTPAVGDNKPECALLQKENKKGTLQRHAQVYVLGDKQSDIEELAKDLPKLSDAPLHTRMLVMLKSGKPVGVYSFDRSIQKGGKAIQFTAEDYSIYCPDVIGANDPAQFELPDHTSVILSESHPEDSVTRKGAKVMIPADAVYLELDYHNDAVHPGSPNDLEYSLHKSAYDSLVVESPDGGAFHVGLNGFQTPEMTGRQAQVFLIKNLGLSKDAASKAVKVASVNYKYRAWMKAAQTVDMHMPPPQMPSPYGYDDWSGAAMVAPSEQVLPGQATGRPALDDDPRPPDGTGGQTGSEQLAGELAMLAEQAASTGQRSVFEHGTIGSLAKLYNSSEVVDQYLPEIRVAIDRLGRLLFLFHWNNEDFEERYGSDEMADIESQLKNVFKMLNDLYLQLKNKAVDAGDESVSFR